MDNNYNEYMPTESERQEYLAYKSPEDVLHNFNEGVMLLESELSGKHIDRPVLICGGMAAFDKGLINFINRLLELNSNLFLLSEVTAEYRRYTADKIRFPFICTPHLLAKEIIVLGMNIPVSQEALDLSEHKPYVKEAADNMNERYITIGAGYAQMWSYYAYRYICRLLDIINPREVWLWNEFYAFHHIFRNICRERGIAVRYMEFGCIPGTICIEKEGQQGESTLARHPFLFSLKKIGGSDIENADRVLEYCRESGLNRNVQPARHIVTETLKFYRAGRKTLVYLGQNDYESGLRPYSRNSRKYHSPVFSSTLEALEYIQMLAIKNDWNLIYKPHPIMSALGHDTVTSADGLDIVTEVDINSVIDAADVVVTILSQSAYIALIREKPVVMLGYTQLKGKGCTYEAFSRRIIEKKLKYAMRHGYTQKQKKLFLRHTAQLLKYYLYDDGVEKKLKIGREI